MHNSLLGNFITAGYKVIVPKKLGKKYLYEEKSDMLSPLGCILYNVYEYQLTAEKNAFVSWEYKLVDKVWNKFRENFISDEKTLWDELDNITLKTDRYNTRRNAFLKFLDDKKIPYQLEEDFQPKTITIPKKIARGTFCDKEGCLCALGVFLYEYKICTKTSLMNFFNSGSDRIYSSLANKFLHHYKIKESIITSNDMLMTNEERRNNLIGICERYKIPYTLAV